jgi:ADP-heptose:LPS heptosyltransferase
MRLAAKQRLDALVGGLGIVVLRPIASLLGALLRRDHSPAPRGDIAVLKFLGGGSLVLASPSLLGIRRQYGANRMILVTTPAVVPFARVLGIFDDCVVIDDRGVLTLAWSGVRALARLTRVDTIIDLEPYSRLSTVLAILSMARNRFNFFLDVAFWRERLATHLVFLNRSSRIDLFYEAIAAGLGAQPVERAHVAVQVARIVDIPLAESREDNRITQCTSPERVCLAPACSDFGLERMLTPEQWLRVLETCLPTSSLEIVVIGGPTDRPVADAVIAAAEQRWPNHTWTNACDGRPLEDSLRLLAGSGYFLGVDSGPLHFARLFGVPSRSIWGPTDPATRLDATNSAWDRAYYTKIACSPCIHAAETPPCGGRNACIEAAVLGVSDPDSATAFAAKAPIPAFSRLKRNPS